MRPEPGTEPLLTLEPLIEAVREGIQRTDWELSGSQKTTSHEFEGRWAGESTRSAYLFFHPRSEVDHVSIDVYLDETSRGLRANVALVVDGPRLCELGNPEEVLGHLADVSLSHLPSGVPRPLTLRLRLREPEAHPAHARVEVRFKVHVPAETIARGSVEVAALATSLVAAFEGLLADMRLQAILLLPS